MIDGQADGDRHCTELWRLLLTST